MKMKWIKTGIVLFLAAYLFLVCRMDSAKDIPIEKITEVMEKDTSITTLIKGGESQLRKFYGIDASKTEGFFFYKAESPMSVDEILIVKTENKGERDMYTDIVKQRLRSQKNSFEGYGAEQTALLNEAFAENIGKYVLYAAGENAEQWKREFVSLIR